MFWPCYVIKPLLYVNIDGPLVIMSILFLSGLKQEEGIIMSDPQKEKVHGREKKTGKTPSEASHSLRGKETTGRTKEWVVTSSQTCVFCVWRWAVHVLSSVFQLHQYCLILRWHRTSWRATSHGCNHGEYLPVGWDDLTIPYYDTFDTWSLSATFSMFSTAGPHKHFPVAAATDILKNVLTSYLQEEKYEVEWSQKMTKTLCEVRES